MTRGQSQRPRVGLFVTCLVDLMRPSVGFAAVRLLQAAGCDVVVPAGQTCCGQPAYNGGDRESAKTLALRTIDAFAGCDYIVAPSGSCAAMLKRHYRLLCAGDEAQEARANAFAERVHELISFLVDVRGVTNVPGTFSGRVAYHDGCSGLRELAVMRQPRALLASAARARAGGARRRAGLLRLRRPVLRQVSRHLRGDRRQEDGSDRRRGSKPCAGGRARLPPAARRHAVARRL